MPAELSFTQRPMTCAQSRVFRTAQGVRLKQPTFPRLSSDAMKTPLVVLMFLPETRAVAQDMAWQHRSAVWPTDMRSAGATQLVVLLEYLVPDGSRGVARGVGARRGCVPWCCDRVFSD
jgi:hypothetical protein